MIEQALHLPCGAKPVNRLGHPGWHCHRIERLGAGLEPRPGLSPWVALRGLGHAMARRFA